MGTFKICSVKCIYDNFDFSVIINPYYAVKKINQKSYNFIADKAFEMALFSFFQ